MKISPGDDEMMPRSASRWAMSSIAHFFLILISRASSAVEVTQTQTRLDTDCGQARELWEIQNRPLPGGFTSFIFIRSSTRALTHEPGDGLDSCKGRHHVHANARDGGDTERLTTVPDQNDAVQGPEKASLSFFSNSRTGRPE